MPTTGTGKKSSTCVSLLRYYRADPNLSSSSSDVSLYDDLLGAKSLFLEKRKLFIGLSLSHLANIPAWQSMARQTKKGPKGVISVDRHTTSKGEDERLLCGIILTKMSVPSQTAIYERMKANLDNFSSTQVPTNQVGLFFE
jgi:hypothetical protein